MECPDEHVLAAMVEQALDAATISALEVHFDSCDRCREVVALAIGSGRRFARGSTDPGMDATQPAVRDSRAALLGETIGERYKIRSLLGRGGMGTVYLARDTKLDRDVAIKVHRTGASTERLQREAVAMAQLAHPNVVNVFEVGEVASGTYVVMEYVRGSTLRAWTAAGSRRWQDIVDVLIDAGTGLAAAHAAGLVHRDFKPDNVLVGDDGRPRVSDFGLARSDNARGHQLAPSTTLDTPLTVEGTVLGSPAYMAPEQLAGDPVDARADQFAFAVVAWESLYGGRPFDGKTLGALMQAIVNQQVQRPAKSAVPARIARVLERALAERPEARYPDVRALLAALRRAAAPRTRRRVAIAGGATLAIVIAALPVRSTILDRRHAAACAETAGEIEQLFGLRTRAAMQARFLSTKSVLAASSFQRVADVLDRHAGTLASHTEAACVKRADPARRTCLDEQTSELAGVIEMLGRADASLVRRATDVAWALWDPTPCDDATFATVPPTRSAQQTSQLGRARALGNTGKYRESVELATPLLDKARRAKDRGLELAVLLELAAGRERIDPPAEAAAVYQQALNLAEELGRDHDAALALAALASLAEDQRDFAEAHRTIALARAKLARLGGSNPMFEGKLHMTEAQVLMSEYKLVESEAALRKAIAIMEPIVGGDHPNVGSGYGTLAQILIAQDKGPEAVDASKKALAILEGSLGPDHPTSAGARMTVGQALIATGALDEARTQLLAADAVFVKTFGPKHPIRSGIHGRIGRIEQSRKNWEPALASFRTAMGIMHGAEGPTSLEGAGARLDIAVTLAEQKKFDEAAAEARTALEVIEQVAPEDARRIQGARVDLLGILRGAGQHAQAVPVAKLVLAGELEPETRRELEAYLAQPRR